MVEIWTPLFNKYLISNLGRIMNKNTGRTVQQCLGGRQNNQYYIICLNNGNRFQTYAVHKLVAKTWIPNPENKRCVDHIDGNPLNNNVENLRWVSHSQNQHNRKKNRNGTSQYKGVSRHKNKWLVHIAVNGNVMHIGYYNNEIDAANAYDNKARELHGEYARTNF